MLENKKECFILIFEWNVVFKGTMAFFLGVVGALPLGLTVWVLIFLSAVQNHFVAKKKDQAGQYDISNNIASNKAIDYYLYTTAIPR